MGGGDERLWVWWLEADDGHTYLEDCPMSDPMDPMSLLLTAFMVAFLRLVDAVLAVQQDLPVESLRPRRLVDLDDKARRYVEQILAFRRGARDS
jgi:hypothetical protein